MSTLLKVLNITIAVMATAIAGWAAPVLSAEDGPVKIAVISEESAPAGASISKGARIAAKEINQNGGINGRDLKLIFYDNHSSASDAVRAFQRAVRRDDADAVVASYISEVVLALQPWAARFEVPFIGIGASSAEIASNIHENYDKNKYSFQGYFTAVAEADAVCAFVNDILHEKAGMRSAVVMSENAAWTDTLDKEYEKCLPDAGLEVLDVIEFAPDTTDFTPIYNKIENLEPDVIITGMAHVGVQPVVQWSNREVPIPMAGVSSQASTTTFWSKTSGAANGVITITTGSPDVPITDKTIPFADQYKEENDSLPSYSGYAAYDVIGLLAAAIEQAGSTDAEEIVSALEETDFVGTQGRIQFYDKDDTYTHSVKFGKDLVSGVILQWQDGKQVPIWPQDVARGELKFPDFVELP